tara:strand:- start:481 stop:1314 length:834 start_codon:yes stop_codon:yes gene_type:complete
MAAMKAKDINLSKISLSSLKTLPSGGKMLYLNYNGGISPLYLETPEVSVPFDLSYFADNEKSGKYSVSISMKDIDENVKMKEFHDKLLEMDEFIKEEAMKNSVPWFKKPKMSKDTIESLFTPMVKIHTDPETGEPTGKFPPRFGFKIVKKEGKIQCSLYDGNKQYFDVNNETDNPIDINRVITKGSMLKVVLKCNGVWLANGKFGCTWRAEQIRVKVPEGGLNEFAILSDSDDEDGDVNEDINTTMTMIEDSSDEEKEPSPPPEPKKKTRKVRVKKE